MSDKYKQRIENWLKGLKDMETKHKKNNDKIWLTTNEVIGLLIEARKIFKAITK